MIHVIARLPDSALTHLLDAARRPTGGVPVNHKRVAALTSAGNKVLFELDTNQQKCATRRPCSRPDLFLQFLQR